ncbi:hypothetical protein [uncultured Methanomethylovorans sp.]|uniref:hypothetical protein n=1 Tax=uncultured Methanomethylovorans sp. TaxID=183759 RepID=UPI002AA66C15|nr:hypothetical protein [uncultured Methanomethylovorans sp.]
MTAALQVGSDQLARLQEHLAGPGKCRNKGENNPRYRTPEREEEIFQTYQKEGSIWRTCKKTKCSKESVRIVLKARGLR